MKCKDCKHYNGATMPGAGLCNATQARTFATTVCFNGLFTPKNGKTNRIARPGRNSATLQRESRRSGCLFSTAVGRSPFLSLRFPFVRKSLRQRLCPSGHAFSGAKVLPWRNIQVPLRYLNTIFQQLSRFSIVHISRTLNTATIKFCPNSLPVSP